MTKQAKDLQEIGKSAMACIAEMVTALQADETDYLSEDRAREAIQQDSLSVEVRGDWHDPSAHDPTNAEYHILLSTGGPAARIVGELNQYGEPETARLEVQDWFLPWTEYTDADENVLLAYAGVFYYGE